jgi:DNA-binding MarR family transcriptional regulator
MRTRKEIEKEIIVRIFQTANILQTFLDNDLASKNLTTKQFYLMIMMSSFDYNPTISEVSNALGSSRQNCMQLALKLEKNGYIKVEKDELDARSKRLYFTDKAIEFWSERDKNEDSTITKLFGYINSPDLSTTNHILNRIFEAVNNFEDRDDDY